MNSKIALCLAAVFELLTLSSCTVIVDGNNRPCGLAQQPVHVGKFGPGHPYRPIGGTIIASGGIAAGGLCSPQGAYAVGGFQTRPLPQRWGQVNPYGRQQVGYGCGQPQPQRVHPYNRPYPPVYNNQQYCPQPALRCATPPPMFGLQPGCYNPYSGRWN